MNKLYFEINYPFINEHAKNNPQNHEDQLEEVAKAIKAYRDYVDSVRKLDPIYKGIVIMESINELQP